MNSGNMNHGIEHDRFLQFEKDNALFTYTHRGVHYWHLLRSDLLVNIMYGKDSQNISHPDMNVKRTPTMYLGIMRMFLRDIFIKKGPADLFVETPYRFMYYQNEYIDPFFFYYKNFPFTIHHQTLYSREWPRSPIEGSSNAALGVRMLFSRLFYKLKRRPSVPDEIVNLCRMLNAEFELKLDAQTITRKIHLDVSSFLIVKSQYKKILKGKFRCVSLVCHYTIPGFSLIQAARELGIPSVELQHGMIGVHHKAYNFIENSNTGKYLPDYLFTYGEYWNETCRLPAMCKKIAIGNPLFDRTRKSYADAKKIKKSIIFYSSGVGEYEFSKMAGRFADLAAPLGYKVMYKFHPGECNTWRTRYPFLADNPNIEKLDQHVHVYEYMSKCEYHVGSYSTVIYEALAFGEKTFVFEDGHTFYIQDIIEKNYVISFKAEEELLSLIVKSEAQNETAFNPGYFYADNSLTKMEKSFSSLINR